MPRTYTEEDVSGAIDAVSNRLSAKKALKEWGIPYHMLTNRLHSAEPHSVAHSHQQRLSDVQEKHLVNWILAQEALGLPLTHAQIREFAGRILKVKGDGDPVGKSWMQSFLRRHPEINTKKARLMESVRTNGATADVIRPWFSHLALPVIQGIKPANRYNMDEAGIMEGMGVNGLVVGASNSRTIQRKTPGSRAWTSFIECISADGRALPPLVIYKGKSLQDQWFPKALGPYEGWEFTTTDNS